MKSLSIKSNIFTNGKAHFQAYFNNQDITVEVDSVELMSIINGSHKVISNIKGFAFM